MSNTNDINSGNVTSLSGIFFLVGYMGCGKSTKAKQLAHRLNCPVIDLDAEIVAKTGKTIAEYFGEFGESGFRDYESELLKTFDYPETCVVATGGGLPCFFDNMDWMNAHGETVYLQMEPAALVSRLHNRQKRPLIKDLDDEQLLVFIKEKLQERDPFYTQAKLIVDAFDLDGEKLEAALLAKV
ncbi:shikimate kinase [Pedobacter sp. HDW13]|uniref:shikimate kinase n=1 Tax=unclassified Pedobacter TaxID=2628915 RepID=UPI000F5A0CD5|nr:MULTISPECIES: shikimate kinase [unclassified Pedobacter]QIL40161.1 shikimate kinase [Pedobacter sp. HDW13]RQO70974.1 shikimate kinase [Pedobacter sp. KBW01]